MGIGLQASDAHYPQVNEAEDEAEVLSTEEQVEVPSGTSPGRC